MSGDGYMECAVYVAHGACSCSTGVPGIVCPLGADQDFGQESDRGPGGNGDAELGGFTSTTPHSPGRAGAAHRPREQETNDA